MSVPVAYTSLLVRIWREPGPELCDAAGDWHSEVERIQDGRRWTFSTVDELLAFLRRQADVPAALGRPPSE